MFPIMTYSSELYSNMEEFKHLKWLYVEECYETHELTIEQIYLK